MRVVSIILPDSWQQRVRSAKFLPQKLKLFPYFKLHFPFSVTVYELSYLCASIWQNGNEIGGGKVCALQLHSRADAHHSDEESFVPEEMHELPHMFAEVSQMRLCCAGALCYFPLSFYFNKWTAPFSREAP